MDQNAFFSVVLIFAFFLTAVNNLLALASAHFFQKRHPVGMTPQTYAICNRPITLDKRFSEMLLGQFHQYKNVRPIQL